MSTGIQEELGKLLRGQVLAKVPLRERTTYRIGGEASLLACPADLEDLRHLHAYLVEKDLPSFVLGGGANLLVSDRGFSGVAVHLSGFNRLSFQDGRVKAGAGLVLDEFIKACLKRGLVGLECLSGIPGSLGGALRMNAGAFGAEISDHLVEVECLDGQGCFKVLPKDEVEFSYRRALRIRETYIIGATFRFPLGSKESLFLIREDILARRRQRQPWQYPTAGSVFKRPRGHYAGKLIEDAGLKGTVLGRAQISPKHAGIVINLGGARASDVLGLIRLARDEVLRRFRIELELEQELIGFESEESLSSGGMPLTAAAGRRIRC